MDASALDRAIDDAAREMTAAELDNAFRARVMARLDERRPYWQSPWVASPIAVAIVIVLLLVSTRSPRTPTSSVAIGGGRVPLTARSIPLATTLPAPETPVVEPDKATTTRRASRDSLVAALAPARLEVPSLALTAIDRGESIQVPELESIAPITVAPIGEPQGERQ